MRCPFSPQRPLAPSCWPAVAHDSVDLLNVLGPTPPLVISWKIASVVEPPGEPPRADPSRYTVPSVVPATGCSWLPTKGGLPVPEICSSVRPVPAAETTCRNDPTKPEFPGP